MRPRPGHQRSGLRVLARQAMLEVGQRVRVELTATDVERGFLDFVRIG